MRDTWIDDHTGDETVARPDFKAELRSQLAKELVTPARRSTPSTRTAWRAIGWASVAAAAAVAGVVVLNGDDKGRTVVPVATTQVTTDVTTGVPSDLRDRLVGVLWLVTTIDGVEVALDSPPSFTLQNTGGLVGFDGCNHYGFDGAASDGWTLDGDTIRLSLQLVQTAMACPGSGRSAVVVDGTRVELAPSGVLTLFRPDGIVYTAQSSSGEVPQGDVLQVPASGGPVLAPTVLAELDVAEDGSPFHVALLPDRIVVALVVDGRFDGNIVSYDRAGNRLPDTRLDAAPSDFAGLVLGGYDGTLYVETSPEVANTQTTKAYTLDGEVWREVASYFVEENNDASYSVSGEGLLLGPTLVIPAQTVVNAPDVEIRYPGTDSGVFEVVRTEGDLTTVWTVSEDFENFSLPPAPMLYGNGAILEGNANGDPEQQYVAVLTAEQPGQFFRPNGWRLVGADGLTALFATVVDGSLQVGVFRQGPSAPQVDWSTGNVLELPLGFSSVDKVLTGINPVLGEPTADSGWFVVEAIAPGDEDCLAGQELRVLHWGDLTVAFKKGVTPDGLEGEQMWSWVVGDPRASGFSSFREPVAAPIGTPTGLHTEDGFGVGSSIDDLQGEGDVLLSDFINDDGTRNGFFSPTDGAENGLNRSFVIDADGTVIGFGTTQLFC